MLAPPALRLDALPPSYMTTHQFFSDVQISHDCSLFSHLRTQRDVTRRSWLLSIQPQLDSRLKACGTMVLLLSECATCAASILRTVSQIYGCCWPACFGTRLTLGNMLVTVLRRPIAAASPFLDYYIKRLPSALNLLLFIHNFKRPPREKLTTTVHLLLFTSSTQQF